MKKNVWIINHYATGMYERKSGRHYYFAKYLKEAGYNPVVFCASFVHKGINNYIENGKRYIIKKVDGITFVLIRTPAYTGNGKKRLINIFEFTKGILKNYKRIAEEIERPDVILGSSVHPLSCVVGIIIGNKYKIKKISEIRDLWPDTLVMLGAVKGKSLLAQILYRGERWIYQHSDDIIFTMEGGWQYIVDRKWNKYIHKEKVHYINNGVDIEQFDKWKNEETIDDADLQDDSFKLIYTGTIGPANGLNRLVEAAEQLQKGYGEKIKFLIYGRGEEEKRLVLYCKENNIHNIVFKGYIEKKKIPYVLCQGDVLLVNYAKDLLTSNHNVLRYGGSHNKLFEYLASGKPILYTQPTAYGLVKRYQCGLVLEGESKQELVQGIEKMYNLPENCIKEMGENARKGAYDFEFKNLTQKLISVIEREC